MSLASEVRALAQDISNDNDGLWLGDGPDDYLGHIATYIGRLEAVVHDFQQQSVVDAAHAEALS